MNNQIKVGMLYAFLAYLGWGFFPIYWKFLKHVPLVELLSQRVIWAFIFYTIVLLLINRKITLFIPTSAKHLVMLSIASILLMGNWLVYIYSVNSNQIVESSLGYFINPLANILIGVFFLKEHLRSYQIFATILAGIGVGVIWYDQKHMPTIALFLAITFSCYGVIKKKIPTSGLFSNQFESLLMLPVALLFLVIQPSFLWVSENNSLNTWLLLIGTGIITGLPLIFFSEAAQRIPYYLMGFFQFLAPTLQFLSGVVIFDEPLSNIKLIGFIFIWSAIFILMSGAYIFAKKNRLQKA